MPTLNTKPKTAPKKRALSKLSAQQIYNSGQWKGLRMLKLINNPICEHCGKEFATEVHHIRSFQHVYGMERFEVAYDYDNLQSLCEKCHHAIHNEQRNKRKNTKK